MDNKIGILLCGHGSRDLHACTELERVVSGLAKFFPSHQVLHGFLEFARPTIPESLEKLRAAGVQTIYAIPAMLFAAGHVKNDIPSELLEFKTAHPEMNIVMGSDLGVDARLLRASADRIKEALMLASSRKIDQFDRNEILLFVVGRGTSDPDANSNISKITRMLWEGLGFGWAETGYSGVAFPRVAPALRMATKLGYRRIVVFPYFLFTGILVQRIYAAVDEVAAEYPQIEFIKVGYLNDHPEVLVALAEQVPVSEVGEARMNCFLCKYREQIVGYEADIGTPQVGHHHHVRGVGADHGQHYRHIHGLHNE